MKTNPTHRRGPDLAPDVKKDIARSTSARAAESADAVDALKLTVSQGSHASSGATNAAALSLPPIAPTGMPERIKAVMMTPRQRDVLRHELSRLDSDKAGEILAHLQVHPDGKGLKEPSLLRWAAADRTQQVWVLGPTFRSGSAGKVHVACDADEKLSAVKHFRLEAKREKFIDKVNQATASLLGAGIITELDRHVWGTLASRSDGASHRSLNDLVKTVLDALKDVDGAEVWRAHAEQVFLKTRHVEPEVIEAERNMLRLAESKLAPTASVRLGGDVYDFIPLAYGAVSDMLGRTKQAGHNALARWVGVQAAAQVGDMHARKIVHRDLKPENMLLGATGELCVADLGYAVVLNELGQAEGECGSPYYIAPEVLSGEPYDEKADIHSLGATLATIVLQSPLFHYRPRNNSTVDYDIFKTIHPRLSFQADGTLDGAGLAGLLRTLENSTNDRNRQPVMRLFNNIVRFHERDPRLCGFVLRHMLCPNPRDRLSMKEVEARLRDTVARESADAGAAAFATASAEVNAFVAANESWRNERDIVIAYKRAYLSEP